MPQQTALAAAIASTGATSITVDDFLGFPASGAFAIYIGSEALRVTAGHGTTTWTVTRGYLDTTAATHLDNSTVTLLEDGVINLADAKKWTANSDTVDDGWLLMAVNAINRAIVRGVNVDLSSSPDTTRTYRSSEVKADGRRLWVPGGIRAFTAVETGDGTTWTAVTSYVEVGPAAHSRPAGEPGAYIEVKPEATTDLCASYYVRITGTAFATFGWDAWPMDLVQDAVAALQRMTLDRSRQGNYPTETAAMRYLNADLLSAYRNLYFPGVR